MTRVDFAFGAREKLRMTCEVVRKQFSAGRPLLIYAGDAQLLARFDLLLWGFEATAYIPHVDAASPLAAETPILLTSAPPVPQIAQGRTRAMWLVNLDPDCPPNVEAFERVLEIVSIDEGEVLSARRRWTSYKKSGHDVRAHDLSKRSRE